MNAQSVIPIAVAMAAALGAHTSLAQTSPPAAATSAERGWIAVGQCAQKVAETARHACIDDVLRQAGLLTPQAEARERRQQFGLAEGAVRSAPAIRTAPPAAAASAAPATPSVAPAAPVPPPTPASAEDRLQILVALAGNGTDGKVTLTSTDGAVWRQTDSDTIRRLPQAGESVNIRKASLGSFLCELPSHVTFRPTDPMNAGRREPRDSRRRCGPASVRRGQNFAVAPT